MSNAPKLPSLETTLAEYRHTGADNDRLFQQFASETWNHPRLAKHRRYIEENELGFGDPAFHAMWHRLLDAASRRFGTVRALEVGVYKGQVISLWSLLARELPANVQISAITPLAGQPMPRSQIWVKLRYRFDRKFRERVDNGDFYPRDDYEGTIRGLFRRFALDFDSVRLFRGYSTDPAILQRLASETFHLVYVDGDHTYQGALHDFQTFGPKVIPGGWLVADDAGRDLPGKTFWKGHEAVTRATSVLPQLGFQNILNVGHNRVYERVVT